MLEGGNLREEIRSFERENPKRYLDYTQYSWGRTFSDCSNIDSYSSNYAVITDNIRISSILKEIDEYYESKNVRPRILNRADSVALELVKEDLIKAGYCVFEFFLLRMFIEQKQTRGKFACKNEKYGSFPNEKMKCSTFVKVISNEEIGAREEEFIKSQDDGKDYGLKLIQRQINSSYAKLYIAYEGKVPVSMALVEFNDTLYYISDVYTGPLYRRKGFGTILMQKIIHDFSCKAGFLYTDTKEAIQFYLSLGFVKDKMVSHWMASKKDKSILKK